MAKIERVAPSFQEKIWGSTGLAPWFPEPETKIGEVWFDSPHLPLIKFLFTTERLSVQVHPWDEFAREHEGSNGKTEMWHILRAAPGAKVAAGFREPATPEAVRDAALSGTIEAMLNWVQVRPGDSIFIPAGTVHAIGAGLSLCEIQQHSDVTYRIYDYGRARELHLDKGIAVANLGTCPARAALPVRCPYFHTEKLEVRGELQKDASEKITGLIVLQGEGLINGEPFLAGEVYELPAGESLSIRGNGTILRTYIP
ncbi:MAG: class I mannose-6-phosphate isomerase [Bryobacterales bacterium]|nr:class I mannose-6-phosphate isomerase [Bryobacterales bacterium]